MNYKEKFIKRHKLSGENSREAYLNQAIKAFERDFDSSPSFHQVDIDNELVDAIINRTNRYDEKLVNFRHGYDPNIGAIVTFKNDKYLIMEKDFDDIYTFAIIKKCNYVIPIKIGEEREFVGYDYRGKPLYETKELFKHLPCIVESKYYSSNENAQLPLPEGKLTIYTKYIPDTSFQINEEFLLYDKRYVVADIDYTRVLDGVGIMEIIVERKVGRE